MAVARSGGDYGHHGVGARIRREYGRYDTGARSGGKDNRGRERRLERTIKFATLE